MDELLKWRWQKFDRFYDAFMRRELAENLERRKEMMIAALWANSGFEGDEGANNRREAVESLEHHYEEAITAALGRRTMVEEEVDLEENPFFAPAVKGVKRITQPRNDEGSVAEALASDYQEVDQT